MIMEAMTDMERVLTIPGHKEPNRLPFVLSSQRKTNTV